MPWLLRMPGGLSSRGQLKVMRGACCCFKSRGEHRFCFPKRLNQVIASVTFILTHFSVWFLQFLGIIPVLLRYFVHPFRFLERFHSVPLVRSCKHLCRNGARSLSRSRSWGARSDAENETLNLVFCRSSPWVVIPCPHPCSVILSIAAIPSFFS